MSRHPNRKIVISTLLVALIMLIIKAFWTVPPEDFEGSALGEIKYRLTQSPFMDTSIYLKISRAIENQEYDKAEKLAKKLASKDKFRIDGLNALGKIEALKDNQEEALDYFEQALKLNPESADTLNNIGTFYYEASDMIQAESYLLKALEINQFHPYANLNLAEVYMKESGQLAKQNLSNKERAEEVQLVIEKVDKLLDQAMKHGSNDSEILLARGLVYTIMERQNDAFVIYEKLKTKDSQMAAILFDEIQTSK